MVRDLPQTAAVCGREVVVTSWVGRTKAGVYRLPVEDWRALEHSHPNPIWWKRDYVRGLTVGLDLQPGGPEQAERIRDAQVYAIDAALGGAT
jgi:hypothetical protein